MAAALAAATLEVVEAATATTKVALATMEAAAASATIAAQWLTPRYLGSVDNKIKIAKGLTIGGSWG